MSTSDPAMAELGPLMKRFCCVCFEEGPHRPDCMGHILGPGPIWTSQMYAEALQELPVDSCCRAGAQAQPGPCPWHAAFANWERETRVPEPTQKLLRTVVTGAVVWGAFLGVPITLGLYAVARLVGKW